MAAPAAGNWLLATKSGDGACCGRMRRPGPGRQQNVAEGARESCPRYGLRVHASWPAARGPAINGTWFGAANLDQSVLYRLPTPKLSSAPPVLIGATMVTGRFGALLRASNDPT